MSDEDQPAPGLVHVENDTTKRPNAVVLDRRTVALTVLALLLGTFGGWALNRGEVQDAKDAAEAAVAQSSTNAAVIAEVQEQSERNGALVEQGVDCLVALQQQAVLNAEEIAAANAASHGYPAPVVSERVSIPTDVQRDFIENACTRFFTFQEAEVGEPPPPPEP